MSTLLCALLSFNALYVRFPERSLNFSQFSDPSSGPLFTRSGPQMTTLGNFQRNATRTLSRSLTLLRSSRNDDVILNRYNSIGEENTAGPRNFGHSERLPRLGAFGYQGASFHNSLGGKRGGDVCDGETRTLVLRDCNRSRTTTVRVPAYVPPPVVPRQSLPELNTNTPLQRKVRSSKR